MNLADLQIDITNTLNHNGHEEVRITTVDESFTIRVGYWEQIPASLIEKMEEYHSVRISEDNWDDEDCGELYSYFVEIIDPDTGYTLNELNELDSNYSEEADYLMSLGADDTWGVA